MRSKVLSEMRNCQGEGAGGADQFSARQSQAALKSRELKEPLQLGLRTLAELRPEQLPFIVSPHRNGNSIKNKGGVRKDSSMCCHRFSQGLEASLFYSLHKENSNRQQDTLDFYLMT